MNRKEFSRVRHNLGRTQVQMARLLGVSVKGIQSFEQGWRDIPASAERELLVFLGFRKTMVSRKRPCWSVKECSAENMRKCPVWEFRAGNICWFFNGTLCQGSTPKSWEQKMKICRSCEVFRSVFDLPAGHAKSRRSVKNAPSGKVFRRKHP
jgi:hypothetical protein